MDHVTQVGVPDAAGPASGRAEHATRELRQLVLSLSLRPGESLPERRLERLLGVSRSPVRQALARLAQEGLVVRGARSYQVAPIDVAEIDELFALRTLLETAAVRWAASRADAARMGATEAALARLREEMPSEQRLAATARLHLALARAGGNRFLVEELEALLPRVTRARYLELVEPAALARGDREHERIVRLVKEGRGEEAARLMADHLERTRRHLQESLERLGPGLKLVAGGMAS
ncbi:MAG: GntR family transcriptional regulator [Deinococcales bacterium]